MPAATEARRYRLMIRQARKKRHLSLRDVSRMTRISVSMLSEIENGNRRLPKDISKRKDLAHVLGLKLNDFERFEEKQRILSVLESFEDKDFVVVVVQGWISHNKAITRPKGRAASFGACYGRR